MNILSTQFVKLLHQDWLINANFQIIDKSTFGFCNIECCMYLLKKNIFQITTFSKHSKLWLGLWLLYDNIHHSLLGPFIWKFHPRHKKLNKDNSQSKKYNYMTYYSFFWIFLHILWFITVVISYCPLFKIPFGQITW